MKRNVDAINKERKTSYDKTAATAGCGFAYLYRYPVLSQIRPDQIEGCRPDSFRGKVIMGVPRQVQSFFIFPEDFRQYEGSGREQFLCQFRLSFQNGFLQKLRTVRIKAVSTLRQESRAFFQLCSSRAQPGRTVRGLRYTVRIFLQAIHKFHRLIQLGFQRGEAVSSRLCLCFYQLCSSCVQYFRIVLSSQYRDADSGFRQAGCRKLRVCGVQDGCEDRIRAVVQGFVVLCKRCQAVVQCGCAVRQGNSAAGFTRRTVLRGSFAAIQLSCAVSLAVF